MEAAWAESSGRVGDQAAGGVAVQGGHGFDGGGVDVADGERDVADMAGIVGTKLHCNTPFSSVVDRALTPSIHILDFPCGFADSWSLAPLLYCASP